MLSFCLRAYASFRPLAKDDLWISNLVQAVDNYKKEKEEKEKRRKEIRTIEFKNKRKTKQGKVEVVQKKKNTWAMWCLISWMRSSRLVLFITTLLVGVRAPPNQ